MADETKKILFDVEIETSEKGDSIQNLTNEIEGLLAARKQMLDQNKQLLAEGKQSSEEYLRNANNIELNKNKVKELTNQRTQLIKTIDAEKGSVDALNLMNKKLIEDRNKLNKSTEEGRQKIDAINKIIDANTKKINDNLSETEKQKQGYNTLISILDKLNPGTQQLVTNLGTVSKGFTSTIGAVQQYGFSLKALGQIPVLQLFTATMQALETLTALYKQAIPTVEDYLKINKDVTDEYEKQKDALDLLDKATQRRIEILKELGGKEAEINEIRKRSTTESIHAANKALAGYEKNLTNLQNQLAALGNNYDRFGEDRNKAEKATLSKAIEEQTKKISEQKEIITGLVQEYNLLDIQSAKIAENKAKEDEAEVERLKAKQEAELELLRQKQEEESEIEYQARIARLERELEEGALRAEREAEERKAKEELNAQHLATLNAMADQFYANEVKRRAKDQKDKEKALAYEQKIERLKNEALIGMTELTFKKQSALKTFFLMIFKQDAIKETIINTRVAAMAAYKSVAGIPIVGPVLGGLAAAAVVAYGALTIGQMIGVPFAKGGKALSGTKINSSHGTPIRRDNGDNLLATVKTGEVILNEEHQRKLGGDSTFRKIGVPGFANSGFTGGYAGYSATQAQFDDIAQQNNLIEIANALLEKQIPVLVYQDFEAKQAEINEPIVRAKVI